MLWPTRKIRNSPNMVIESPLSRSTRRMWSLRSRAGGRAVTARRPLPGSFAPRYPRVISARVWGASGSVAPLAPEQVGAVGQPDPVLAGQGRLGGDDPVDLGQDPGPLRVREGGDEADRGEPVQRRGPVQVVQVVEGPLAEGSETGAGVEGGP